MRGPLALRSLRTHLGATALLVVVCGVLTAATTLGVAVTRAADARAATVLPLVVLGLAVVPTTTLELVRRRRDPTTLARVRGVGGGRLVLVGAGPPALAALLGSVLGAAAASGAATLLPAGWGLDPHLVPAAWGWATAVALGAALLAAATAALAGREALAAALRRPVRAAGGGPAAVVGAVVLVVLGALAVQLSLSDGADGAGGAGGGGGAVVLAGTGVLGLLAGEVVVGVLGRLGRLGGPARRAAARPTPARLLALRAVTGVEPRGRVRVAVAAGVVVAGAVGASLTAAPWAQTTARAEVGGPVRLALPDTDVLAALLLTREVDPDGRWLMAGAVSDERTEAELRVVWLDLDRWERVSAAGLDDTPVRLGEAVATLADGPGVEVARGSDLTATTTATAAGELRVAYLDADGALATAVLDVARAEDRSTGLDVGCEAGCVVVGVEATGPVEVEELALGGTDLLAGGWSDGDGQVVAAPGTPLALDADPVVPSAAVAPVPVLTAGGPRWDGGPQVPGIGGVERAARPVGSRALLPLVGASGLLADLPLALAGAGGSVPRVRSFVLARADTPTTVLDALARAASGPSGSPGSSGALPDPRRAETSAVLGAPALAELRARTVVAVGAGLLGLLVLLGGGARRVAAARAEAAALRLVGAGVPAGRRASPAATEAVLLAAVVAAGVLLGWLATASTVVTGAGLVPTGSDLPTLAALTSTATSAVAAATVALVGGAAVGASAVVVRLRGARRSAPHTLLEERA